MKKIKTMENNLSILSVLNTLQYKQIFCILTLTKRNGQFIDKICTIHRPEKSLKVYKQHK